MSLIYGLHDSIQALREQGVCPVTLICGPCDSGKSTVARAIISRDISLGHAPVFVDLDCGQNAISLPGAISAATMSKLPSVTEGLLTSEAVVSYEIANVSYPSCAVSYIIRLVQNLSRIVFSQLKKSESCR